MEDSGWYEADDGSFAFEFFETTPEDDPAEFFTWLEYLADPEEWDS